MLALFRTRLLSAAGPILLLLLAASTCVDAFQLVSPYLYTQEVSYCSAGRAVEVERFDIRYYHENSSVGIDLTARSVATNLNADINIQINAYGKSPINATVNLCDILDGALCPLPEYQFDGSFVYVLPDTFHLKLPGLAWTVPDLDATATIILLSQEDGSEALCLSTTLSNGKTTYLNEVRWAAAGLAIGAFVVALIHSFWPISPYKSGPEWRFATIISYFQHIALCGFLSLNYPNVYKNFTLNFAWAQGLIYMAPIDNALNRMRYATGGVNREGQSYNIIAQNNAAQMSTTKSAFAQSAYTVPTVREVPTYNLISGIETTAEDVGITYPNAWLTVFIVTLLLICVMIVIIAFAVAGVAIYSYFKHRRAGVYNLRYFIWTNILRMSIICYTPIVLFVFWQFLHKNDSGWLAIFIAVLVFISIHLAIGGIYWHVSKIAHRALNGGREQVSLRWTTVSQQFKRSGGGYVAVLAASAFTSSAFVAFAQGHGLVQLIPLIVIESIVFVSFCIWRPFANKWSNVLIILISFFKIAAYAILITFSVNVKLSNGIILAVLGFVVLAIQSIMTVILFIVTVYNLGTGLLWSRSSRRQAEEENRKGMTMSEKRSTGPLLSASIVGEDTIELHQPPPISSLYIPVPGSPASTSVANVTPESGSMSDEYRSPSDNNDSLRRQRIKSIEDKPLQDVRFWQKNQESDPQHL